MNERLRMYLDCEIQIHYLTDNNMYTDSGRLVYLGDTWIELAKPVAKRGIETFLIPTTAVRIIKVLGPPETDEQLLLRPAFNPDTNGEPKKIKAR